MRARSPGRPAVCESLESRTMLTGDLKYAYGLSVIQKDMATDAQGNAYLVGTFTGTVDFNPSPRKTHNMTAANAGGDMFVAKFTPTGSLAWAVRVGAADNVPNPTGIAISADFTKANIWITGDFENTFDFDPTAGTYSITSLGGKDMFILGFDQNGVYRTANRVGTTDDETPIGATVDGLGRLYIAGQENGATEKMLLAAQFNYRGRVQGTRTYTNAGVDIIPTALVADGQGDLYTAGTVSADFDFGGITVTGPSAFILKLDPSGFFEWANSIAGATINDLGANNNPNTGPFGVLAAGSYTGTIDVNPLSKRVAALVSAGGTDAFFTKYDANGAFLWANTIGGTQDDAATSIATDTGNSVWVSGYFRGTATFPRKKTLTSFGDTDAFVSQYSSLGLQWSAVQLGGTGADTIDQIAIGQGADLFATGPLKAPGDYNPGPASGLLAPVAGHTEDTFYLVLD